MLLGERSVATPTDTSSESTTAVEPPDHTDRTMLLVVTGLFAAAVLTGLALQAALPTGAAYVLGGVVGVGLALVGARRLSTVAAGGFGWWILSAVATVLVLDIADTRQHQLIRTLLTALILTVPAVLRRLQLDVAGGASLRIAVSDMARAFTEPTSGLAAILLGLGTSAPLSGAYSPAISEADSGWFVTSTLHVRENGIGLLQETQDVFLPHLTLGPLLALDGYRATIAFVILNMVALCTLAAYVAYRLTNRGAAALVAAVSLLAMPAVVDRVDRLPMYAACFFFGYGAAWVLHRAMSEPGKHRWAAPLAAGVGLVLAFEAHGVGQIFLAGPFLLLLIHPWSRARRPLLISLATVAVISIPRVVVNLSEGGLTAFRSNYTDFATQKYLSIVNQDLWGHNTDTTPLGYLTNLPGMTQSALGGRAMFILLAIPVVLAAMHAGRRALTFASAAGLLFLAALAINSPATYSRYLAPLGLGVAVVVAVGIAGTLRQSGETRTLGRIFVTALVFAAFFQTVDIVSAKVVERETIIHGPWPILADAIDDDRAVVGVRSHQLLWADPDIMTENGRTMSEQDWVTFLTWPSDEAVADVMERYDAGWVYVMPDLTLEILYHQTWLEPTYGEDVDHIAGVSGSDDFCLAAAEDGYLLYRYGACQPRDLVELPPNFAENHFDPTDPDLAAEVSGEIDADELEEDTGEDGDADLDDLGETDLGDDDTGVDDDTDLDDDTVGDAADDLSDTGQEAEGAESAADNELSADPSLGASSEGAGTNPG